MENHVRDLKATLQNEYRGLAVFIFDILVVIIEIVVGRVCRKIYFTAMYVERDKKFFRVFQIFFHVSRYLLSLLIHTCNQMLYYCVRFS